MRNDMERLLTMIYEQLESLEPLLASDRTDLLWRAKQKCESAFASVITGVELAYEDDDIEWDEFAALVWARHELADYCHALTVKLGGVAYD